MIVNVKKYIQSLIIFFLFSQTNFVSQNLSKEELQLQKYINTYSDEAIQLLEKIVNINSGTLNIKGNRKVGNIFKKELDSIAHYPTRYRLKDEEGKLWTIPTHSVERVEE